MFDRIKEEIAAEAAFIYDCIVRGMMQLLKNT